MNTIFIKFFFLIITVLSFTDLKSQKTKDSVWVEVDFSKKVENKKSMSGFLHYDNIKLLKKNIIELQPKFWRIGYAYKSVDEVVFLQNLGVTPILVISDLYGYPGKKNNKEWSHPLHSDRLKNVITAEYKKFKNTVIYDIWNEPFHQDGFGDFDKEEYYKIFKKAHDIIRSLPGGDKALITGPSFDRYNENEMDDFLRFCNVNNVRVDILCWHEIRDGMYYKEFSEDMNKLRNTILPRYPKVGVKKIILNEIINQYSQFSPSEVLHVFKMLEDNNIDGACKACWAESNGVFNCNNSINGLLDKNGKPRSVWWAYKLYNQSIKNRVMTKNNFDQLSVFASYNKGNNYIIINNNSGNRVVNTTINLKNLKLNRTDKLLNVKIYEIPNTNEAHLDNMIFNYKQSIKINKNITKFHIPNINPKTVYYLLISDNF